MAWHSPWLDFVPDRESQQMANIGTDRTDKTGSVSFVSDPPVCFQNVSRAEFDPGAIKFDDPTTWPTYVVHLEQASRAQGDPANTRRQVEAEVAFLRTAKEDGWQILDDPVRANEGPGGGSPWRSQPIEG